MKKVRLFPFIGLVLLAILPLNGSAAAQTGTVVYVDPPLTQVDPDGQFTVDVMVANVEELWAFDIILLYNTNFLTFNSAEFGDFLNPDWQVTLGEISPGVVKCEMTQEQTSSPDPQSGSGWLCRFTFTAKSEEAYTYLTIDPESILSDRNSIAIPYTPEDGDVQIGDAEPGFEAYIPFFVH